MKQPWEYAGAAEELADLRAEVERLTEERDRYRDAIGTLVARGVIRLTDPRVNEALTGLRVVE